MFSQCRPDFAEHFFFAQTPPLVTHCIQQWVIRRKQRCAGELDGLRNAGRAAEGRIQELTDQLASANLRLNQVCGGALTAIGAFQGLQLSLKHWRQTAANSQQ